jgi:hypothetical protein
MARIVVMSEPSVDRDYGVITLDEKVAPAQLEKEDQSAQLVERVRWAVHDADGSVAVERLPASSQLTQRDA